MLIAASVLLALVFASCIFWVIAWISAWRFFRSSPVNTSFAPPVSILKPVRGVDKNAYDNFVTFCEQHYQQFEIRFGVSDPDDPAIGIIQRLQANFPQCAIHLHIAPEIGANDKSSVLHELAQRAVNPILVISDSDIRVTPQYLSAVVAPLEDPSIGLVTCLYRTRPEPRIAAILHAIYLDTSFLPCAIIGSRRRDAIYGFGATLALRKADLERIGGYRAIADYIADDFQLGAHLASLGLQLKLSRHVVSHMVYGSSLPEQLQRELRWARSLRTSTPWGYRGLVVIFTTPLSIALLIVNPMLGLAALPIAMLVRGMFGWWILGKLNQHRLRRHLVWLPVRDCLWFMIWIGGLAGRRIIWRGRTMNMNKDGRVAPAPPTLLQTVIRPVDAWLRRRQGIFEFTHDSRCMLRLSRSSADRDIRLSDGTQVQAGDPILDIHFWNEQIPKMNGSMLKWATSARRQMELSMAQLAEYVESEKSLHNIQIVRARAALVPRRGVGQLQRIAGSLRFEMHDPNRGLLQRGHDFMENFLLWGLLRAFNAGGLRKNQFIRERHELWISRETLIRNYTDKVH